MSLAGLFSDGDYRFQPALRRGSAEDFFKTTVDHVSLCAERQRWLRTQPQVYSACLPDAVPLLDECLNIASTWRSISPDEHQSVARIDRAAQRCIRLGEIWEPDFLLLKPNTSNDFVLLGGCVCFPSSWKLDEKVGHPLQFIHGAVPGLNAQLGRSITAVLRALTPETAWLRHNWGLTRSAQLNQHPARGLPRLDATVKLTEVWLRVEHQALVALPLSNGILFGIRIAVHPLEEVKVDTSVTQRLVRALQTMPEDVALYKGIAPARSALLRILES